MIIRTLSDVRESARNVKGDGWKSARMALGDDRMGFSFHITTMFAGRELKMHYKHHLEAVFIMKGTGTIEDTTSGEVHRLEPGVLYMLDKHDPHIVRPETHIVAACVFNPPVNGAEVHDEDGAYPASVPNPQPAAR